MINKFIITVSLLLFIITTQAKDYDASYFGIESNGNTLNTGSIQKAINYIHENGGGRLIFHVGRYVTGSIYLKSNVTIHLKEGAVLLGSLNPFDYDFKPRWKALILAFDQDSIAITGQGVIDGRGYEVAKNILGYIQKGLIKDPHFSNDRPHELMRPEIIHFKNCNQITIQGIQLRNSACWVQQYENCKNLLVDGITVDSKNYWNNDGIDLVDCDSVVVKNSFFDSSDDGICLKSHHPQMTCQNILIYNNTVRSSANGIKFGTYSTGGFKNIKIIKNTVYNTYRSAITFAAVTGGSIENILVDSLNAYNTGNIIFLRIGERKTGKKGSMKNISLSNIYGEVAATKPDAGYSYEGPIEHLPRNISPASIVGMPDVAIENVHLKNIEIHYPGGADPYYAKVSLDELDNIPELPKNYPEFSMFKELPAWGFYIRHVKGLSFENVTLHCEKEDFRMPIVLDDVHHAHFKNLQFIKQEKSLPTDQNVFQHNCSTVKID